MIFLAISFAAGVLTILAPCIFPLLPIVVGSSDGKGKGISRRSWVVIGSLALSVTVFTLLLRASTVFISIPPQVWARFSGSMIILVGIGMLFPIIWEKVPGLSLLKNSSNKAVGRGYQKHSFWGDVLMGVALGPVFTTCSPTYLFIVASLLPASFAVGMVYLSGFVLGMSLSLLAVAYLGQRLVGVVNAKTHTVEVISKVFASIIILTGILIFTGYDKKFETFVLDQLGYGATIRLEEGLIERFGN